MDSFWTIAGFLGHKNDFWKFQKVSKFLTQNSEKNIQGVPKKVYNKNPPPPPLLLSLLSHMFLLYSVHYRAE